MAGGLEFCTVQSTARPFSITAGGSTLTSLTLVAPVVVTWEDGTTQDSWTPDGFTVTSAYDASVITIDTTAWVWLVVAVKGVANSARLVKEADYANLGTTVLAGLTCQALYRIVGVDYSLFQEAASGDTLPSGPDGALFYIDPVTHQAVWIQGTQGDTWRYENGIWERLPIGDLGDLYHVASGPHGLRPEWIPFLSLFPVTNPYPSGSPIVILSSTAAKALSLWTGSANGTPRPGWNTDLTAGFDAGWINAVPTVGSLGGYVYPTASGLIWSSSSPVVTGEQCITRQTFSLPAGTVTTAALTSQVDDGCTGIWINGTLVASYAPPTIGTPRGVVSTVVDPGLLTPGGTNLIATWGADAYGAPARIAYRLDIS